MAAVFGVIWLLFSLPALIIAMLLVPGVDLSASRGPAFALALILTPTVAMGGALCCFLGVARSRRKLATWGYCAPLVPIMLLIATFALR
ncbi:hypothetical protein DMC25_12745 [Caulobacter sp. D4A]|nr:hypothetical protein DMC18_22390 [Caulobacter sp. D5]PXA87316.1 hypothetical protein DMC25_12745 [Caulobacter sp. D4A]